MRNVKTITTRNILLMIMGAVVLFYFNACARKVSFEISSVVPAAKGTVKVTKDNNQNYKIRISIDNLAEPERLQPSKKTYVVWMETEKNAIKNIGQINSSTGFLSSKLKASFENVSSFKPMKIFLTAEDDAAIQYPGTQVILSTGIF